MMGQLTQLSPDVRRNFKFDLLAGSLTGLLTGTLNAFILVQARRIGASTFQVSFLAALPFFWMLFSPLWVVLFNQKSPYRIVPLCDGAARVLLILLLLNSTPGWYLFLFALHYLLSSVSASIYCRGMELAYPNGVRGTLMGWVRVGSSLTSLLSTGIAGLLLPLWGVQRLFAFLALFGVGAAISFGQLKQLNPNSFTGKTTAPNLDLRIFKKSYRSSIRILRRDYRFRRYIISLFLFGFANLMAVPVFALYQVDVLKVTDGFISILVLITFISSLICYLIGGRYMDQNIPLHMTIFAFILGPLLPLCYFLAGPPWILLLAGAVSGTMNAAIDLASLNNIIHFANTPAGGGEVNSYMGVHMNLLGIRGTFGPLLVPLLVRLITIRGVLVLLFLLFLAGLGMGLDVLRRFESAMPRSKFKATV